MTVQVTYHQRAERGSSGGGVVTEETDKVEFDEQGRLRFRAAPGGETRRLDPVYVLEVSDAGQGWL